MVLAVRVDRFRRAWGEDGRGEASPQLVGEIDRAEAGGWALTPLRRRLVTGISVLLLVIQLQAWWEPMPGWSGEPAAPYGAEVALPPTFALGDPTGLTR